MIAATAACGRPRWAKLSANTDRIVEVAAAVHDAGAEAVTCINTLLGLAYDPATGAPVLGAGGGGLSGPAIHPVAVRAVHDVHAALPELPIIGVGGVAGGWDATELMLAGATRGAGRDGHVRRSASAGPGPRRADDRGDVRTPRGGRGPTASGIVPLPCSPWLHLRS